MNQNKICPECGAEYLPHIEKCADCGVIVLSSEECIKAQEEQKQTEETAVENSVKVMEGDMNWMSELSTVLLNADISCTLNSDGCRKGCCGDTVQLKVSPEDLERSQQTIEEYLMELDPDLRLVKEMLGKGKCPACGASIGHDARECPDCGLPLIIIGEED
ncbi:MAG: hypothetical protein Q8K68_04995 [Nitrospirota bacterium]|nr:hypothetical protein [Nitrospirota bacterium]